jgi:hypothetical protein
MTRTTLHGFSWLTTTVRSGSPQLAHHSEQLDSRHHIAGPNKLNALHDFGDVDYHAGAGADVEDLARPAFLVANC